MHKECFDCDISQMKKICAFQQLGKEKENQLIKLAREYLKIKATTISSCCPCRIPFKILSLRAAGGWSAA